MAIKLKIQKDYLLTEASVELPANFNELDAEMRKMKATGKIVAVYSDVGLLGVNVEQKSRATEKESEQMRTIMGVKSENL